MYKSIRVQRFRCFRDLALSDLAQVNLISGRNNVGKTTLLEALYLHCGARNPELALRLASFRGMEVRYTFPPSGQAPWDTLFYRLDRSCPIEISGVDLDGNSRSLKMTVLRDGSTLGARAEDDMSGDRGLTSQVASTETSGWGLELQCDNGCKSSKHKLFLRKDKLDVDDVPPPPFPALFVFSRRAGGAGDDVDRFSKLSIQRRTQPIVDAMRIIEPRLRSLSVNVHMGSPVIWADIELRELLPVQILGDGVSRVLSLMTSIAACPSGVVLIDEVDAGIHHSVYGQVWRAIMELALNLPVQVFATTHSHECLVAAREAAREFALAPTVLRLHRLDRSGEDIEPVTYDDEALDAAIAADLEIR